MQDKSKKPTSVAIVGAGIAGLSCASALRAQGLSVQVFESSSAVGGRMSTLTTKSWECDHGAQYFTAQSAQFREELSRWQAAGVAAGWNPRLRVIDELPSQGREAGTGTKRYVGVPSMLAPAQFLAKSLPVQLSAQVDRLEREPRGWRLHISGNGWQESLFDVVVLALPAPHAQSLLSQIASPINELIGAVRMRPAWALMLRCDESFDPSFDAAFVNSGPIRWIARNLSKPQRQGANMWVLHANAQWSEAHLEEKPSEVAKLLIEAFMQICTVSFRASEVYCWPCADTDSSIGRDYLWDSEIGLGLCGDWLKEAKIEGAWTSAIQLAKVIAHSSAFECLDVKIVSIDFASIAYESALALRNKILRIPLGRSLDYDDLKGEENQFHFGIISLESELIACVSVKKIDEKHYKIRQMAVSESCQGKGLGARLVRHVESELVKSGATKISLHARESAISFYEKLGFRCDGKLFDEVGISHIKMIKNNLDKSLAS